MPNTDTQIRALVDSFVHDLSLLIRQSSLEAVQQALLEALEEGVAPAAPKGARRIRKPSSRTKSARRQRRTPADLEAADKAIVAHVRKNPGCQMGQLATALGEKAVTLRVQVARLVESGGIRKEGEKRNTRYFVGKKGR